MPESSWFEAEPPLLASRWAALARLVRRAAASWAIWVTGSVLAAAALTVWSIRNPGRSEVTVVLQVSEGELEAPGAEMGSGMLRAHLSELAFTNAHLLELMARHPTVFRDVDRDPPGFAEKLRNQVVVEISEDDFIEDRMAGDPPRMARVALTFTGASPQLTYTIAHELADLVVSSTLASQSAAAARAQAAAESAATSARADMDRAVLGTAPEKGSEADPRADQALRRWEAAIAEARAAALARKVTDSRQALRFEVVDPGRIPAPPTAARKGAAAIGSLLGCLLVACLLAGSFDPRILDVGDLVATGVTPLGALPVLPVTSGGARKHNRHNPSHNRSGGGAPSAPRV